MLIKQGKRANMQLGDINWLGPDRPVTDAQGKATCTWVPAELGRSVYFNLIAPGYRCVKASCLQVDDKDMTGVHNATNIVPDSLTLGVGRLEFHRPSPITVTDAAKGKLLALDPNGPSVVYLVNKRMTLVENGRSAQNRARSRSPIRCRSRVISACTME